MIAGTQPHIANLLRLIGDGDEPALDDLQERTRKPLLGSIRRIVRDPWHSEEVLQDVYLYVWRHAGEYRDDRGSPSAWLHMLARSRALDRLRLTQRDSGSTVAFDEQHRRNATTGPLFEQVWQESRLWAGWQMLSIGQKRLLEMSFVEGFSHTEIAERTGTPLGTIKTRIRKALVAMRERIA